MGMLDTASKLGGYIAVAILLTSIPVSAVAAQNQTLGPSKENLVYLTADDTYERICLVLGWTDCAEWRILDQNGVEKNRVIGPYPETSLRALCGSNLCGGGSGGSVELIRIVPKEIVPVTDYGPGPKSDESKSVSTDSTEAQNDDKSPTEDSKYPADSQPEPTPEVTERLGGYAVVHPVTRHVCGVIVATRAQVMSSEYMGCPSGSRTFFQTRPSQTGNVAGYHGKDVTYYDGIFYLSWGSIVDGIATDRKGRSWDTGTGEVLSVGSNSSSQSISAGVVSSQSQSVSSSAQSSSSQSSSVSDSENVPSSPSSSAEAQAGIVAENSQAEQTISRKTVVGTFLGRWAVRFENLAGSTVSIRAGGNWYKFTLASDSQLFSRRSIPGFEIRVQVWVDGNNFSDAAVVVR